MRNLSALAGLVLALACAGDAHAQARWRISWWFIVGGGVLEGSIVTGHRVPISDERAQMMMPPGSAWSCEAFETTRESDGGETRRLRCVNGGAGVATVAGCFPGSSRSDALAILDLDAPGESTRVGITCERQ